MTNLLARQRLSLFGSTYEQKHFYPEDNLLDEQGNTIVPDRSHFMTQQSAVIAGLKEAGLI
jgi:hypothetical protein